MKKKITKYIGVFMSLVLLAGFINIQSVHAEEYNIEITERQTVSGGLVANENVIVKEVYEQVSGNQITEGQNSTWDGKATEAIYDGEEYRVIFKLADYWEDAYKAEITIENTKDTSIENWYIRFPFRDSISNIWNAEICDNADDACTIKNVGWNQQILAGESVSFGFMVSDTFKGFPEKYELLGTSTEVVKEDYTIVYQLNNDWGSGFVGTIL